MVERDTFISFATCAIDLLSSFTMSNARAPCSTDSALFLPSDYVLWQRHAGFPGGRLRTNSGGAV